MAFPYPYHFLNSAARALLQKSPGSIVVIQYDGGGIAGAWLALYAGLDNNGNALFNGVINLLTGLFIPGLTRVPLHRINSVNP